MRLNDLQMCTCEFTWIDYLWPVCDCIIRVSLSQTLVSVKRLPRSLRGGVLVQSVSAVGWCLLE